MKKLILCLAVATLGLTAGLQAQSCHDAKKSSSCCKKGESTAMVDAKTVEAADKLAMADETIEKRVCAKSGNVSYVRTVASDNNEPKVVTVAYNAEKNAFEDVAEKDAKACCTTSDKGCCGKGDESCKKSAASKSTNGVKHEKAVKMN